MSGPNVESCVESIQWLAGESSWDVTAPPRHPAKQKTRHKQSNAMQVHYLRATGCSIALLLCAETAFETRRWSSSWRERRAARLEIVLSRSIFDRRYLFFLWCSGLLSLNSKFIDLMTEVSFIRLQLDHPTLFITFWLKLLFIKKWFDFMHRS